MTDDDLDITIRRTKARRRLRRESQVVEKTQEPAKSESKPKLMLIHGGRVGRPARPDRFI